MNPPHSNHIESTENNGEWRLLSEINLPRQIGAEKLAMDLVAHIIEDIHLSGGRLEQLKQAIASATLNAMNLKNLSNPELPISIRILVSPLIQGFPDELKMDFPINPANEKGNMSFDTHQAFPYGWGFFLIDRTLEPQAYGLEGTRQRIELFIYVEGR